MNKSPTPSIHAANRNAANCNAANRRHLARLFRLTAAWLGLALLLQAGAALAQEPTAPPPPPPAELGAPPAPMAPMAPVAGAASNRPLTLRFGTFELNGDLVVDLSNGSVGKPFFLTPNFYYGVNDALTLGIAHNPFAETWAFGGGGLCLSGTSGGCGKVYNNVSFDALWSFLRSAGTEVAGHGGVDVTRIDAGWLDVRVGVMAKLSTGIISFLVDPAVSIGVTHRSDGNKGGLTVPLRIGFQLQPQVNLALITGIAGPLDGFGDAYGIPFGVGALYAVEPRIDLRAQFVFNNLAGKGGSGDFRTLALGGAFRF